MGCKLIKVDNQKINPAMYDYLQITRMCFFSKKAIIGNI